MAPHFRLCSPESVAFAGWGCGGWGCLELGYLSFRSHFFLKFRFGACSLWPCLPWTCSLAPITSTPSTTRLPEHPFVAFYPLDALDCLGRTPCSSTAYLTLPPVLRRNSSRIYFAAWGMCAHTATVLIRALCIHRFTQGGAFILTGRSVWYLMLVSFIFKIKRNWNDLYVLKFDEFQDFWKK